MWRLKVIQMAKFITDGTTEIGYLTPTIRKKPCLCVKDKNTLKIYGTFTNKECADEFIDKLADFVGAEKEGSDAD